MYWQREQVRFFLLSSKAFDTFEDVGLDVSGVIKEKRTSNSACCAVKKRGLAAPEAICLLFGN